jgi:GR25 family glycosyltransferase involved in LPS biosynthesis
MKFSEIPKFVINLETRPENLENIRKEMDYIGWEWERFNAINRGDYMGCTLSHLEIIKIAKERGYKRVMVIEDDCIFMPYAKSFLEKIEEQIGDIEFGVFNVTPTLNRHMNVSEKYDTLLDLTNLPPKQNENHTETHATNMMIYDVSVYDEIPKISTIPVGSGGDYYHPIDGYLAKFIYPNFQSYAPILPIAPQRRSYSDVSQGMYNNFYTQTYNWNLYSPFKIPNEFRDESNNQIMKEGNTHKNFYYVS